MARDCSAEGHNFSGWYEVLNPVGNTSDGKGIVYSVESHRSCHSCGYLEREYKGTREVR